MSAQQVKFLQLKAQAQIHISNVKLALEPIPF